MTENLVVSLPEDALIDALEGTPGVELVKWEVDGPAPRERIDIAVMPYLVSAATVARIDGVRTRLVQWQSIGVDGIAEHLPEGIAIANATTVHEASTAELAVGLALAAQRKIPEAVRNADKHLWEPGFQPALADQRVLLVGYGGVSKATESRLAPFEVELTRVASRARSERNPAGEEVFVHGIDELPELLPKADIVIIGLPLNDSTKGLFDETALSVLSDGALLINVGRGPVVDTQALVDALRSGRLRAALDVVDPEPLPPEHPLWDCPNLLITPHNGGDTSARLPRIATLVRRQIKALQEGREPENLVK